MGCGASTGKRDPQADEQARQNDKAKRAALGKYSAPKIEFTNLLPVLKGHVPRARKFHTMTAVDDHSLFVIGGLCSAEDTRDSTVAKMSKENPAVTSSVNRLSVRDASWHQVPTEGEFHPSGRGMHSAVNYQGDIFVFGSHNKKDPQLYMLKCALGVWRLVEDSGQQPPPTAGHSCVVAGDTMWVFGGEDDKGVTNRLSCFEFETRQWTQVDSVTADGSPLLPRRDHSAVVYEELMLVFGGFGNDSDQLEFMQFSAINKSWSEVFVCSERRPEKRGGHCCELYHQYMMIFGGMHHGKLMNDLWVFDILTSVWTKVDTSNTVPPTRRAFARSAIAGPYMYVHGGGDDDALFRDMHRVDVNELVRTADPTFMLPEPGLTEIQSKKHRDDQYEKKIATLTDEERERLKRTERRTQHYNQKFISNLWQDAMTRSAQVIIH